MCDSKDVQYIRSPAAMLRSRLATGDDKAPKIDVAAIARAETAIGGMQGSFIESVDADIATIRNEAEAATQAGADAPAHIARIFALALDVRGSGATFGYPLLTEISTSLKDFVAALETMSQRGRDTVEKHAVAMQVVLHQDIRGEGGAVGKELLDGLAKLTAKARK